MSTFIGFNTIDQVKKFTVVDAELVKRDLLNALNISQGELPGRPDYGTVLWQYVFDNQSPELNQAVTNEVTRIIGLDPRIVLLDIQIFPQQNSLTANVQVRIAPNVAPETLSILFDQQSNRASFI